MKVPGSRVSTVVADLKTPSSVLFLPAAPSYSFFFSWFVMAFCLSAPLVSVRQRNSHILAAKQTSMGHHLSAALKSHLTFSNDFSSGKDQEGDFPMHARCWPICAPFAWMLFCGLESAGELFLTKWLPNLT